MSDWEPMIDNSKGLLYFYNKKTADVQFDYPKKYDPISQTYSDIFFENWVKVEYTKELPTSNIQKEYIWRNITNGFSQTTNPNSTTFILEAALNDNIAFFELYIENGGNINYTDKLKRNSLHYVAINDNSILANLLIKLGCKINQKDIYGISPLIYCIKYHSYKTLKLLIKNGCNLNIRDNKGNTALHYAIKNKNIKLIATLIQCGSKLEIKNKKGQYPIDIAVENKYWKLVKSLSRYSYILEDEKFLGLKDFRKNYQYLDKNYVYHKKFFQKRKKIIKKKKVKTNKLNVKNSYKSLSNKDEESKSSSDKNSNINSENDSDNQIDLSQINFIEKTKYYMKKSYKTTKKYFTIFYLFLLNSILPYVANNSSKIFSYTKRKTKSLYNRFKVYLHNAYIYYRHHPDIENQIEYSNYVSPTTSFEELNNINNINSHKLFPDTCIDISTDKKSGNSKQLKKTKIHNWMRIKKIAGKYRYFNKKNKYSYKIPINMINNFDTEDWKFNGRKMDIILDKYKNDNDFIKCLSSQKFYQNYLKYKEQIKILNYDSISNNNSDSSEIESNEDLKNLTIYFEHNEPKKNKRKLKNKIYNNNKKDIFESNYENSQDIFVNLKIDNDNNINNNINNSISENDSLNKEQSHSTINLSRSNELFENQDSLFRDEKSIDNRNNIINTKNFQEINAEAFSFNNTLESINKNIIIKSEKSLNKNKFQIENNDNNNNLPMIKINKIKKGTINRYEEADEDSFRKNREMKEKSVNFDDNNSENNNNNSSCYKNNSYSKSINKSIDNINLMLNQINDLSSSNNKNLFNNIFDDCDLKEFKSKRRSSRRRAKKTENKEKDENMEEDKKEIDFKVNNEEDKKEINLKKVNNEEDEKDNPNIIGDINVNKNCKENDIVNSSMEKSNILEKILLDYNTELQEIKK